MKLTTLLFLLLASRLVSANDIDRLKTKEDVEKFIVKKVNKGLKGVPLFASDTEDTTTYADRFFKLDLNNDGLTDLVINGLDFFAIIDNGDGTYREHYMEISSSEANRYGLTNIFYQGIKPLLVFNGYYYQVQAHAYTVNEADRKENYKLIMTDTLIFINGRFAEYNPTPDNYKIKEIHFSTSPCFGTCPIFELAIYNNRNATFKATKYNKKEGEFYTIIDAESYDKLLETIGYIKLDSLRDSYSVNHTDDQTVMLQVKFYNGQEKRISDYGAIGTFGLQNLYEQLFNLRNTQKWK